MRILSANQAKQIDEAKDEKERMRLWAGRKGAFGAFGRIAKNLKLALRTSHIALLTFVFSSCSLTAGGPICYSGRMKVLTVAGVLALLSAASCAKKLDTQLKDAVRTFDALSLKEDQIEVENVTESGDELVAEIKVTTAVRMVKKEGKWIIEEVRLADRRWEKAEHILAVINEKRGETTRRQLEKLAAGIGRFQAANNQVPQVQSQNELVSLLSPDYLSEVIQIDAWANPFFYKAISETRYDLRSAGPDEVLGTSDDLVMRSH